MLSGRPSSTVPTGPAACPLAWNWDALANPFAWNSVLAAWGFGSYLSWQVKKSARKIPQREAQARVDEWLRDEAPKIIRQSVQRLSSVSQSDAQADAADEIGNEVG